MQENTTTEQIDPGAELHLEQTVSALDGLINLDAIKGGGQQQVETQNTSAPPPEVQDSVYDQENTPAEEVQRPLFENRPPENQEETPQEEQVPATEEENETLKTEIESQEQQQTSWLDDPNESRVDSSEPFAFETNEQLISEVNKRTGLNLKDVGEMNKLFESYDKQRKNASEFKKSHDELTELRQALGEMPAPISQIVKTWADGGDWQNAMKGGSVNIDLNKSADEHNIQDLVGHYFAGKFSPEDFTDPSEALNLAIDVSKERFKLDKDRFVSQRAKNQEQMIRAAEALETSAVSSVKRLQASFPGMSKDEVTHIQRLMTGENGLTSLFYDENGVFREDAAEKLAFALFGKQQLEIVKKRAQTDAMTQANLNSVQNMSKKPRTSSKGQNTPTPEVPKDVQDLLRGIVPKRVY